MIATRKPSSPFEFTPGSADMWRICTLWDGAAALAAVFAFAVTFPSEWMDWLEPHSKVWMCFLYILYMCFYIGVFEFTTASLTPSRRSYGPPLGLVMHRCLIMASCLTVAAAIWCETAAWPVCFYSSVCREMGSLIHKMDVVFADSRLILLTGECVGKVWKKKNPKLSWFAVSEAREGEGWVSDGERLFVLRL